MAATSSATANRAFAAWSCILTRSKRGQSTTAASVDTSPAIAQPPTRAGMASADAGMVTAMTKERIMPMFAAAT